MIRSSTRITHQRCIDSRESDFDKPPGHFGSGVCSVKYRAQGGNRGRAAGWLATWSWSNAVTGYGQNAAFWDLPVKCSHPLRAKRRFLRFARKMRLSVTGKTSLFEICP